MRAIFQAVRLRPRVKLALKLVLGLFVAFTIIGFFAVPPAARWLVESQAGKFLGRTVQVERVRFNPLTLTARIESLRITETDGRSDFFSLGAFETNLDVSSIWHRAPVLQALRIERPSVRIVHLEGGRYNFSDILDRLATKPKSASSEPMRFSVNNIDLVEGRIEFDDRPVQRHHIVDKLKVGIPFVSNFPIGVASFVTPKLHAVVNGSPLRLEGKAKPFADRRQASIDLVLEPFDIVPYLAYVPAKLPVTLEKGRLATQLRITWAEAPKGQSFSVEGKLDLSGVALKESAGPLLSFDALHLDLTRFEPLATPVLARIASIRLDAPVLDVRRSAAGQLNLTQLQPATVVSAPVPLAESAPAVIPGPTAPSAMPRVFIDRLAIGRGAINWQDEAVPSGYRLALSPIDLRLEKFDLAGEQPARLDLHAGAETGEVFTHQGTVQLGKSLFKGHAAIAGLSLERLRPYFDQAVGPGKVGGTLGIEADYAVAPSPNGLVAKVDKVEARLADFALTEPGAKQPLVLLPETVLSDSAFDLEKHALRIGAFSSTAAQVRALRGKDGRIDVLEALLPKREMASSEAIAGAPAVDWRLELGRAELAGWKVHFVDNTGIAPIALDIADLGAELHGWSNQVGNMAEAAVHARVNKKGRLAVNGRIGAQPLKGDLKLDLKSVDLLSIQPYIDQHYRVLVTQGAITAQGGLAFDLTKPDEPQASYAGNLVLEDFNSLDQLNDTDFLRWKRFALENVKFRFDPLSIAIGDVHLDDFYTRLILDSQGRFNLRELATAEDAVSEPEASRSAPVVTSTPPAGPMATTPKSAISVGKVSLVEGHINYSDRFIRPNYDANLRGVTGSLAGLSSDQNSVAQLELKARLDGSAPVEISGQLNPLRQDRFLDIRAGVKDVDLTGVSTYAAKYVGYGIEKGKLSMDLQYKIRDRKLTAENQIFLDQLTFGGKVDSPQATKLPVLFAVALMKNGRGEVDINLPISGTLDDPQFSVGGIVARVIVNLITKAVTAPFALIGSLFGGDGEELAYLEFPSGLARLPPTGEDKLRTLAKALTDRPALQLDIVGRADPLADRSGIRRALLDAKLRALKAAEMVKRGEAVEEVDRLEIAQEEYPRLLQTVYATEKIPDKPRNALGMLKTLPLEEAEKAVLGYLTASDEDLQNLATLRAKIVRDWLIEKGRIDADRIFLVNAASSIVQRDSKSSLARVDFSLK